MYEMGGGVIACRSAEFSRDAARAPHSPCDGVKFRECGTVWAQKRCKNYLVSAIILMRKCPPPVVISVTLSRCCVPLWSYG